MADKTVKLVFGQWEYRKEMIVTVKGNTRGISVLSAAIAFAYEDLPTDEGDNSDVSYIEMTMSNGDTLRADDEEDGFQDWLGEMLVSAEIVDIKPAA